MFSIFKLKSIAFLLLIFSSILVSKANVVGDSIKPLPQINKTFAVVVHVVLDREGKTGMDTTSLYSEIESMNFAFAPIGVKFLLTKITTIPNFRYEDTRSESRTKELLDQFLVPERINVFYVDKLLDSTVIGLGSLGGIAIATNVGVWVEKGTNPLVHEMGHFWGLSHTFEGEGRENVDGSNCLTEGDGICDTPADPYIKSEKVKNYIDGNCVFFNTRKDANGMFYNPDVSNIMSYYPCRCNKFTNGQYIKMVNTYLLNPTKW